MAARYGVNGEVQQAMIGGHGNATILVLAGTANASVTSDSLGTAGAVVQVFQMRRGRVCDRIELVTDARDLSSGSETEVLTAAVQQFYGERHAPPEEACKLIGNYAAAEVKMISYVEKNSQKCGIPPQIADQLKQGHKGTEALKAKVCNVATQMKNAGPAGPTLSDVLGTSSAVPEATVAKKGGSTFDTLTGNALSRE